MDTAQASQEKWCGYCGNFVSGEQNCFIAHVHACEDHRCKEIEEKRNK